jgi:MFS superfamily sulfate permease-like transporter
MSAENTHLRWFVLDSSAIHDMDTTGEEAMRQVLAMLAERDVTLAVSRCSAPLLSILKDYGLLDEIGTQRLYDTNRDAVAAFRREWADKEDGAN